MLKLKPKVKSTLVSKLKPKSKVKTIPINGVEVKSKVDTKLESMAIILVPILKLKTGD